MHMKKEVNSEQESILSKPYCKWYIGQYYQSWTYDYIHKACIIIL